MTITAEKVEDRNEAEERQAIHEWLSSFSDYGELKISITRKSPRTYKGKNCAGTLPTVWDEPVSEDEIQQIHGGGKFQLKVERKDKKGQWRYAGSRTFEIAGPPKLEALYEEESEDGHAPVSPANGGPSDAVMKMAEGMVDRAQREADAARQEGRTFDYASIITPFQEQLSELQRIMADKDRQLFEAVTRKPEDSTSEKVIELYKESNQSHTSRLEAIRQQHDSELRQLRENHRDDLKRLEDRHDRAIEAKEQAHRREITSLEQNHKLALKTLESSYDARIESLKETIKRHEDSIRELKTENAELRAKKEKGPAQQLEDLASLRQAFEGLGLTGGKEESGWMDKVGNVLGPIADRVAGQYLSPQEAQQEADPMVSIQRRDGQIIQMRRSQAQRMRQQALAMQQQKAQEAEEDELPNVDEASVQRAVQYMEAAFSNGMDPKVFGESARSSIPGPILDYVKAKGVDAFLDNVAKLESSSSLSTVAGRDYVRKVAHYLLRGTVETEETAPPSSPES